METRDRVATPKGTGIVSRVTKNDDGEAVRVLVILNRDSDKRGYQGTWFDAGDVRLESSED